VGSSVLCVVRAEAVQSEAAAMCRGGLEYFCRSPADSKRRRKGNPMPGGYNWATLFLRDMNMGTWLSRLGESQMRQ
jgi:hypothetical protein